MSYEKAMNHATHSNLRKGRNQYMGFYSDGSHQSQLSAKATSKLRNITRWVKDRHLSSDFHELRMIIREEISDYRQLFL